MQALASNGIDEPADRIRQLPVPGVWGYLDCYSVEAGGSVSVHVSAPADHRIEFLRLGSDAILDPDASLEDDRAEAIVITKWDRPAAPRTIGPGSYVHIAAPPPDAVEQSFGLWLRLWALPVVDVVQVAFSGLLTDIDYPDAARLGLLVDHLGQICVYAGDGRAFRHERLLRSGPVLGARLGEWVHVVASISEAEVAIWLDGRRIATFGGVTLPPPAPAARLRIGAMAEGGVAASLLDGDIARPFIAAPLGDAEARRLFDDGARSPVASLTGGAVHADWPLNEERGGRIADASGNGRHGRIVNHGTWMIGGPGFDAANCRPETHDPVRDPERGHGLRLCSDDLTDAGWPASARIEIPEDAESGVYGVRVCLAGQDVADALTMPVVVSRCRPRHAGAIAVLAATNTWHAYGRRPTNELAVYGLSSSLYSRHRNGRPFFHLGKRLPLPHADPFRYESARAAHTRSTHLVRTERLFEAWLRREGYAFEMVSDDDLHADPALLSRFQALAIVGHSEYWSDAARDGLEAWLGQGGQVLCLSGDTLSVRVGVEEPGEDGGAVIECRKIVYDADPRWLAPDLWGESWHSGDGRPGGSFRRIGQPAHDLIGLSFKGMIDDGTPTAFAPYVVHAPDHALMTGPRPVVPDAAGRIGTRSLNGSGGASGYEFDAVPERSGIGPALRGVTVLASADGQRNIEWLGDPDHGADLIHWERPAGGTVVNFGSIAAAGALAVDEGLANLAHNALALFGVARLDRAGDPRDNAKAGETGA